MGPVELVAFALFTGITVCGVAGSLLEMVAGTPLSFAHSLATPGRVAWSVAATVAAGPMMLANDAVGAWRAGRISAAVLGSCACTALVWALAIGIVVLHLAARVGSLLA